jgi:alpha-N-arabinofuranosidase
MQAHNTFENPDAVKPVPFGGAQAEGKKLKADLPAKSVVLLTLEV